MFFSANPLRIKARTPPWAPWGCACLLPCSGMRRSLCGSLRIARQRFLWSRCPAEAAADQRKAQRARRRSYSSRRPAGSARAYRFSRRRVLSVSILSRPVCTGAPARRRRARPWGPRLDRAWPSRVKFPPPAFFGEMLRGGRTWLLPPLKVFRV